MDITYSLCCQSQLMYADEGGQLFSQSSMKKCCWLPSCVLKEASVSLLFSPLGNCQMVVGNSQVNVDLSVQVLHFHAVVFGCSLLH